jgi:hypothetical protein
VNRRDFLKASAIVGATSALAGCVNQTPAPTPTPTQPATGPVVNQALLTAINNAEALYAFAAEAISIAELAGALAGPEAVAINTAEVSVKAALNAALLAVENGEPTAQVLVDAAQAALSSLIITPQVAAAKAATVRVPKAATKAS